MSAREPRSARSFLVALRYALLLLGCAAVVACKSPDDGGGRGDASDSQQTGTPNG